MATLARPSVDENVETLTASNSSMHVEKIEVQQRFNFTDKDIAPARRIYLSALIGGCFFVILAIFAFFSIFWGSFWKSPVRNLEGWVVDFDGGVVGQTVASALTSSQVSHSGKVTWTTVSASQFPNGLEDLKTSVREHHTWVAVAIHEGSTKRLQASLASPNASYVPTEAMTVYAAEARNENAYRNLIRPSVQTTLQGIIDRFASDSVRQLLSSGVNTNTILQTSSQTLLKPIDYTIDNLVPFDVPVASAITFVGLIYQLIFSFFVVVIGANARVESGLGQKLNTRSLVVLRLSTAFIAYFFLSLFYALVSLAFQVDFTRKFGHGGFVVFWMLNWVGMLAAGLALESLVTLFTPRFIPFFMILWIISNVSVCTLPIEVLPTVYRYGYVAPFYNVSKAVRTIIFGTKNQVGKNFAVLIVWILISCVTLPIIQILVRKREDKVLAATNRKEEMADSEAKTPSRASTVKVN